MYSGILLVDILPNKLMLKIDLKHFFSNICSILVFSLVNVHILAAYISMGNISKLNSSNLRFLPMYFLGYMFLHIRNTAGASAILFLTSSELLGTSELK